MDAEGLKLKIDSKGAQQDLAALSKVLDKTAASADKLDRAFAKAAASTDQNLTRAAKSMEKYAQVAALLSKIKIAGNPVGQIQALGKALDSIGRAKQINTAQVAAVKELGAALGNLRVSDRVYGVANFLNSLGRVRVPSQAQVRNVRDFFSAIGTFKGTGGVEQLSRLLNTLSSARAPSAATIERLQRMFTVLSEAREMPGAGRIANQLDTIALAASRASRALGAMPGGGRTLFNAGGATPRTPTTRTGGGASGAAADAAKLGKVLAETEGAGRKAASGFQLVGRGLDDLQGRFRLSYQAGTLFTTMFASFTAGQLLRSLYDTNIALLKLQKAMLFATGSFSDANDATSAYIGISQKLGLSIKDNIDGYGRFVIAATASGLKLKETNSIYESFATALTVVGASAQQQQLAFYGLTEMMQKGVIYSKEFVRQIGAQIPGMAVVLASTLSKLEHRQVSVADAFKEMHTGSLQTARVLPELEKQLRAMYAPLLSLAQQRPDVAIQRLKNSFVLFAREVGNGKFMSAIGNEMQRLTGLIVEGDGANAHLTKGFQHLADQLGQGLGTAIHALGTGLEFVVQNFDSLFDAVKGFLAFKVAGEFGAIAGSIQRATEKMFGFSSATNAAAAAEAHVSQEARVTATQTAVAAIAAPGANEAAAISNLASGATFGRRAPASAFQRAGGVTPRPSFGQRLNLPLFNWADANEARQAQMRPTFTGTGSSVSGVALRAEMNQRRSIFGSAITNFSASRTAGGVARGIGSGIGAVFEKAASSLALLGPAATAAAVGLAMFSDKASGLKSKGGNDVTYGDIASGALSDIGNSVQGFIKSIGESFGMFGEHALTLGKVVIGIAAAIKSTVSLLFDLAHALGTMLGGAISGMVVEVVKWGKIIYDVIHGNITGAIADYRAGNAQKANIAKNTANGVFSDFDKIVGQDSFLQTYARIAKNSGISADSRVNAHVDDASKKQIEAAVQQNAAAQANMRAATLMEDTMAIFNKDSQKLDYGTIRQQIVDLIDGTYVRQHNGPTAAETAAAGGGSPVAAVGSGVNARAAAVAAATGADSPNVMPGTGSMLYKTAFGHIGENERDDKSTLQGLFQTAGINIDPQKASWCAAFVNAVLATNGVIGTGKLDAASFKNFGDKVDKPQQGDIVVMKPMSPGDSGHVGFYAGTNPNGSVRVLGGNQGNAVNISSFKASDVIGYRRPNKVGPATALAASMNAVGALGSGDDNGTIPDGGASLDADKLAKQRLTEYKQLQAFTAGASPAAGALAQDQERLSNINKILIAEHATADKLKGDFKSVFDTAILAQMDAAQAKYDRDLNDALDPVGKMARLQKQANDVQELYVQGKADEAEWQQKVNQLTEEGYSPADIAKSKDKLKAEQDRADVLKAQLDLTKQLNEVEVRRLARTSYNPVQNLVNEQIMANAKPGQTLAQAREDQADRIGIYTQGAQAQVGENRSAAVQGFGEDLDTLRQSQGLNPSQRAYQADYIKALQGMTSLSTSSLDILSSKASDADKKIAASYASLKQELENPPGFQRWVDGLEPLNKRLEDLKAQFAEGLSDNLTKVLTGEKGDWQGMFKSLQQGWVKGQVDNLLGGAFKMLGLAQPQSPQQQQMVAAQTFGTGADTFAAAVASFSSTVNGVNNAAQTATSAASAATSVTAAAASGDTSGISPVTVTPSIFGNGGITAPTITPPALSATDLASLATPPTLPGAAANDNSGGGFFDSIGKALGWDDKQSTGNNIANMGLGVLGLFGNLLFPNKNKPTYHDPNGIIGTMSQNQVNGIHHDAQANPIGTLLNLGLQGTMNGPGGAFGGSGLFAKNGFFGNLFSGAGGGAGSASSGILSLLSMFSEGGYSTSPVRKVMGGINMSSVPHYAEGTHNTSGIPAVLHPDEAVIPLSRGRKIPVEMNDNARQPLNVSSNITVIAPNPDAFRKATGSIKRDQNRSLKRAATRNLTT